MASGQDNALPFRVFLGSIGFAFAFFGVEHLNVEHVTKHDVVAAMWLWVPALVIEVVAFQWLRIRETLKNLPRFKIVRPQKQLREVELDNTSSRRSKLEIRFETTGAYRRRHS